MSSGSIELSHISKSFPGVLALDDISLILNKGEAHTIVGENGAGKSTLMKILSGIYNADKGEIKIDGQRVHISTPLDAKKLGISIIHQELTPIPDMTVAENIFLRREPINKMRFIDWRRLHKMTAELFEKMEIGDINPKSYMRELSVAKTQLVEIAKAASFDAQYIIMDEPTSAISEREVENLFKLIKNFCAKNIGVIYISHKMDEIFQISHKISVMRDGRLIDTRPLEKFDRKTLISMMVNREFSANMYPVKSCKIGDEALRVSNLSSKKNKFDKISFSVKKGEILGIAGLMGSGRTELVESIFGLRKLDGGEIFVNGKKITITHPSDAIKNKIALIPEDRKNVGLNLIASVRENLTLPTLDKYLRMIFVSRDKQNNEAQKQVSALSIKTPSLAQEVKNLSGGNQQKIVIGKWLLADADVIMLDEPTRGIDVGAKNEVYSLMCELAKAGKAIVMISSELPEILSMSDRVMVMHEGLVKATLHKGELTQENVMYYATLRNEEIE